MTGEIVKVEETALQLDNVAAECGLIRKDESGGPFTKAIRIAEGAEKLRALFTPAIMGKIKALMNTPLGFRTDHDPKVPKWDNFKKQFVTATPYSDEIIKDCAIEATMRGYQMVGNQWNIIGGRFYPTREGITARLKEYPGLTDLRPTLGIPEMNVAMDGSGNAIVKVSATWKLDGKTNDLPERPIMIRVNKGMGYDAVIGKAEKKLKTAIYNQITGSEMSDGEDLDNTAHPPTIDLGPVKTTVLDSGRQSFKKQAPAPTAEPDPDTTNATATPEGDMAPVDAPTVDPDAEFQAEKEAGNKLYAEIMDLANELSDNPLVNNVLEECKIKDLSLCDNLAKMQEAKKKLLAAVSVRRARNRTARK